MALAVADFWKLVIESQLLTAAQCQQYAEEFGRVKGASNQPTAGTLAEWLIAQNILSRYQATILLAGKSGPFSYGDYRVYDRVESGRLAGTFRAVHAATGQPVMLAFLPANITSDAALWSHTVRTAQTLGSLHNPHLRRCYDLVDLGKYRFLVQEDLRGATLRESLAPGQTVPAAEVCRLVRQAALALASLQAVHLAHGVLAPDQFWISDASQAKLLFDPMRRPGPLNFAADTNGAVTFLSDYLAPEMFRAGQAPTPSSDVYALGCIAYQMLAGRPPFPGGMLAEKAARHAGEPIAPLEYAGVPPQIAQRIAYMLAKDPAVRFPNAATVADALGAFVDPAVAAFAPPSLPTTAAFERWVVEHQAVRARRAAQTAPAAPAKPSGPTISLDLGATKSTASVSAVSGSGPSPVYRRKSNTINLIAMGITAVVALVVAIVVFNALGSDSEDSSSRLADGGEKQKPTAIPPLVKPKGPVAEQAPVPNAPSGNQEHVAAPIANGTNPAQAADQPPAQQPREEVVADDGKLLWASPTWGGPIDTRLVGLGAQAMLVIRAADLTNAATGERFLAALGPAGASIRAAVEAASGTSFDELEQVRIVLYADGDNLPKLSYVVAFREPVNETELATKWKGASASMFEGQKLYAAEKLAYYMPAWGEKRLLAVGPIDVLQDVVRQGDKSTSFGPVVDKLLQSTDGDRHITFVASPQFLFGDGRKLFSGPGERLREPLDMFTGDGVRAVALSLHLEDENFFCELRALGALENKPEELAARFADRLGKLPSQIEDTQVGARFSTYGEKTLRRFPQMLKEVALNLRMGVDDGQAVLRCYLPAIAGPNLAQAIDLAIHEQGGVAAVVVKKPADTKPKSASEKLAAKINLTFPKESLDRAMELWSNEAGVKVVLLGTDMMAEGITKNQPINEFNEKEVAAEEILLKILKIASPQGKLVYVLKPESPEGEVVVQITTRTAAATRGDKLPKSLETAPAAPKKK